MSPKSLKKFYYLFTASLVILLTRSQSLELTPIELSTLSGNISLTLKQGIGKLWHDKPVYQDITLDLVCDRGLCESDVWAYAPKFNQELDHRGIVKVININNAWQLQIKLNVKLHPWQKEQKPATYTIELIPYKDKLLGSYTGNFNNLALQGKVTGVINPYWPIPVVNHQPIQPQEHPRLIFRKNQLPLLRSKAKTPEGQAILAQLQRTLSAKIYYQAYVPNAGYHAAGYCFLSLLNQNAQQAQTAWQIVENSFSHPNSRLLEHSVIVAGVALAYDLCYDAWNEKQRDLINRWLNAQADWLLKGDSPHNGWNSNVVSNWNARARGAAGLAALAILEQPIEEEQQTLTNYQSPLNQAKMAQRNIKRYISLAIGDRGFGTEGDHYTTEALILTVVPFLLAYRNVMGQDLIQDSKAEWFLPHYLMRIIPDSNSLAIATYGRHRRYVGGSLFAMGLNLVPEKFLPGVMWLFNQNLGMEGDRSFGINSPQEGIYAFVGYRRIIAQNPAKIFERVLVDEQKGFFVFRNQWQNQDDFVASIYGKREPVGGWSFPDVGSFRISGLGGHWAIAGASGGKWDNENVVVVPKIKPWIGSIPALSESRLDGSGIVSLVTNKIVVKKSNPATNLKLVRSFAVDYSGAAGVPGLFVVVDEFIGAVKDEHFQDKTWVMHTQGQVSIEGQSFIINNSNGATMKGTFITPSQVKISVQPTETGNKIMARGGDNFFVVMTVQKGNIPKLKVSGTGLDAQVIVGEQEIYFQKHRIVLRKF